MKIKKKTSKHTASGEVIELKKQREKKNGIQYELTPSALDYWKGGNHEKKKNISNT